MPLLLFPAVPTPILSAAELHIHSSYFRTRCKLVDKKRLPNFRKLYAATKHLSRIKRVVPAQSRFLTGTLSLGALLRLRRPPIPHSCWQTVLSATGARWEIVPCQRARAASSGRDNPEAHVDCRCRVGQGANGDEIHAGFSVGTNILQVDSPRALKGKAAVGPEAALDRGFDV